MLITDQNNTTNDTGSTLTHPHVDERKGGLCRTSSAFMLFCAIMLLLVFPIDSLALDPRVFYTDYYSATDDDIFAQNYTTSWGGESSVYDTGNTGYLLWHVSATSPDNSEQVVLAVGTTSDTLYGSIYDGDSWTTKNFGSIRSYSYQGFYAAYETESGQLLVVHSTDTLRQIRYPRHRG